MASSITGTIVGGYTDALFFYLHVNVPGDSTFNGQPCDVEYQGRTLLLNPDGSSKPQEQLQTEAVTAVKAQRAAQQALPQPVNVSGTVAL